MIDLIIAAILLVMASPLIAWRIWQYNRARLETDRQGGQLPHRVMLRRAPAETPSHVVEGHSVVL